MTPGSQGFLLALALPALLPASEPVLGYGVTNVPIGQAALNGDPYYGNYSVSGLGSNGLDGVSIYIGEPDTGVFLSPSTSYLEDGNYMIAKPYGRLNGTNDSLLAILQGGRASRQVYPLSLDYSPLAPQSVTYQIFYNGFLQREFTRGTPMVVVDYSYYVYPSVNPLVRRSDGALGTSLKLTQPVTFTFPDLLASAVGDHLFIRVNNPANIPGNVSRVDVFGGGRLYDFTFSDLSLGVFARPHQAVLGVTLQARPNWLRVGNFVNTNELPGILVKLERLGALNLQCEPFHLGKSNAVLLVTATGALESDLYRTLGTLRLDRMLDHISIGFEQGEVGEIQLLVLTNGGIAHSQFTAGTVSVGTNALIGSITAHAKTVENLAGYHVQFAEPTPITLSSNTTVTGDEVRLVLPSPARMEHLHTLYVAGRGIDAITITNEVATAPALPAKLEIARALNSVMLKWPDPNRLLAPGYADYGCPEGPYFGVTNPITFIDPYASVTIPIVRTNKFTFFRLFYQPHD